MLADQRKVTTPGDQSMRTYVFGAAALACVAGSAFGDEFWRQNPQASPGGYSSQDARNAGGLGWFSECADNFTAGSNWTINNVEFWGGYVANIDPGTIFHGATIRFYTDNNGAPGTRVFQQDVLNANETIFEQTSFGFPNYHYSCTLSPAFTPGAPGQYWVSVVGIVDRGGTSSDPQWGWVSAVTNNLPVCEQWFFSPGNFTPQSGDLSFVLNGSVGTGSSCYANCDQSTGTPFLNVADFTCFLQKFAQGDPYANCDSSTSIPVLNVADFTCFLQKFAVGCSAP
jgi:hypothetical protein